MICKVSKKISISLLLFLPIHINVHATNSRRKKQVLLTAIKQNKIEQVRQLIQQGTTTQRAWHQAIKTGNPKLLDILAIADCPHSKNPQKLLKRLIKSNNARIAKKIFELHMCRPEDVRHHFYIRHKNGKLIRPNQSVITFLNLQKKYAVHAQDRCPVCLIDFSKCPAQSVPLPCHEQHKLHIQCFDVYIQHHQNAPNKQAIRCPVCRAEL